MITEVLLWGLKPKIVTADTWYSSQENLKFMKDQKFGFLMGIAKNRSVSVNGTDYTQVSNLEIPDEGLLVYLKKFGHLKVFQRTFKNGAERYYIIYLPEPEAIAQITRHEFKELHSTHWGIESYHRAIKQVCGISRDMVGTSEAIRTHFFCAIRAFTKLELMRAEELIENWYEVQRTLYLKVALNSF